MAKAGKFAFPEFIHTDISAWRPKGDPWVAARVQAVSSAFLRWPSLKSARVGAHRVPGTCRTALYGAGQAQRWHSHQPLFLLGLRNEGSGHQEDLLLLLLILLSPH